MLKHVHIGIRVKDMKDAVDFYTKVMGLSVVSTVVTPNATCTFLSAGDTLIELVYKEDAVPVASEQVHLAFCTEDIFAEVARLKKSGLSFTENSYPFSLDSPKKIGDNSYIFFFRSPNGELIEICQNAGTGK